MLSLDFLTIPLVALSLLAVVGLTDGGSHIPQAYRLFKTRNTSGLAASALVVSMSNYSLWEVYFWHKSFLGLLVVNSAAMVLYGVLILGALRAGLPMGRAALGGLAYVGATLYLFAQAPAILPVVLLGGAFFLYGASCWEAYRSESVAGIAPLTWIGLLACGLASVGLGLTPGAEDATVVVWGALTAVASSFILWRVSRERRRALSMPWLASYCSLPAGEHAPECVCA